VSRKDWLMERREDGFEGCREKLGEGGALVRKKLAVF
jgi:hypothetical protein